MAGPFFFHSPWHCQLRRIYLMYNTIKSTGTPAITNRQPALVMQLMMVNGSFIRLITMRRGRVTNPNSLNIA